MSSVSITTTGATVAAEFARIGPRVTRRLIMVVAEAAADVRDEWRANATETAGAHGVHYPRSIRSFPEGPLSALIHPAEGMKQSGMSFEFGSRNQPPHLDGQRALDILAPRIRRRFESALIF